MDIKRALGKHKINCNTTSLANALLPPEDIDLTKYQNDPKMLPNPLFRLTNNPYFGKKKDKKKLKKRGKGKKSKTVK